MADNILHDHHASLPGGVLLVPGESGVFEVSLGERTLFSKAKTGSFPEENEVEGLLEALFEA